MYWAIKIKDQIKIFFVHFYSGHEISQSSSYIKITEHCYSVKSRILYIVTSLHSEVTEKFAQRMSSVHSLIVLAEKAVNYNSLSAML